MESLTYLDPPLLQFIRENMESIQINPDYPLLSALIVAQRSPPKALKQ